MFGKEKKKKQHYVWRHYLRSWSRKDRIWFLRDGEVRITNLENVAQQRYFYKLKELTEEDMRFIKALAIDGNDPVNEGWLEIFNSIFKVRTAYEKKYGKNKEFDSFLDVQIHNLEENLHCVIENSGHEYLEYLRKGEINFYENEESSARFLQYLFVQCFRTKKMKEGILTGIAGEKNKGINFERIWNVLSHILATNVARNLFVNKKDYPIIILKSKSSKEFITGDQPVINTYGAGIGKGEAPDKLEIYYPISPKLAVLISKKNINIRDKECYLNEEDVDKYNQMIVDEAHSQIYASSKEALLSYITE